MGELMANGLLIFGFVTATLGGALLLRRRGNAPASAPAAASFFPSFFNFGALRNDAPTDNKGGLDPASFGGSANVVDVGRVDPSALSPTDDAVRIIKEFEGLELVAIPDVIGIPTVGYGHTGPDVSLGMRITEARAEELLRQDLLIAADRVRRAVNAPLLQREFNALVSLAFNIGEIRIKAPKLTAFLNKRQLDDAATEFLDIVKSGGKVFSGLVRRRRAEFDLFKGFR